MVSMKRNGIFVEIREAKKKRKMGVNLDVVMMMI